MAADSLGPAFQYSRGFSVYFPWAEPSTESPIMAQYERYRFTTDFATEDPNDVEYLLAEVPACILRAKQNGCQHCRRRITGVFCRICLSTDQYPSKRFWTKTLPALSTMAKACLTCVARWVVVIKLIQRQDRGRLPSLSQLRTSRVIPELANKGMQRAATPFPIFEAFDLIDKKSPEWAEQAERPVR